MKKIEIVIIIALVSVVLLIGYFFITENSEEKRKARSEVPSAYEYCLERGGVAYISKRPQGLKIVYCSNGEHTHKE